MLANKPRSTRPPSNFQDSSHKRELQSLMHESNHDECPRSLGRLGKRQHVISSRWASRKFTGKIVPLFLSMFSSSLSKRSAMEPSGPVNGISENHGEIIRTFLDRINLLLETVHSSRISHDSQEAVTSLNALINITSRSLPSQFDISSFSEPLTQLAGTRHEGNISLQAQASCLLVLHKHLSLLLSPRKTSQNQSHTIFFPSLQVDQTLQQVDATRRKLEDDLVGFGPSGAHRERISQSLRAHLHAIDCSSQAIVALLKNPYAKYEAAKDVLGDWLGYLGRIQNIVQSNSPSLKGEDLLSVSFQNIPHLTGGTWSAIALAVIGYMRHTNVYPVLPEFSHYDLSPSSNSVEFWFPFLKDADERWISETFARELQPLASALNTLVQHEGIIVQVEDRSWSSSYDMMDILRYSLVHPSPEMPTRGVPFSLLASIIYATFNGCEIRALFDLVTVLRRTNFGGRSVQEVSIVAGPIIGETLCILEQFSTNQTRGPLLFSFGVLQKLLSWERQESTFPFSNKNMDYIVQTIFRSILEEQNLVIPLDCDCIDNIGRLCGSVYPVFGETDNSTSINSPIIFYDLQELNVAPAQPGDEIFTRQADVTLPVVSRTPKLKFWEEKTYRRVEAKEKDDICSQIMEGRKTSR